MAQTYEVVIRARTGKERVHLYASDTALRPGDVIRVDGRDWLIEQVEAQRAFAKQARYRVSLRHPDGRVEVGAFRRFRPGAPRLGHAFTTIEESRPASWGIVEEELAHDEQGEPYLELVAERDYRELEVLAGDSSEVEALPDHELEHALAARAESLPAAALATLGRAEQAGLAVELVALEPGELPDWEAAERYIDTLILEEIEDDLIELCGVNPDRDPRNTWLEKVKERLRSDLERFRDDLEGDHDEIEEWDFRDGHVFASVGGADDEADPDLGHGWMCRLVDASALGAAGFARVRKTELLAEAG